MTKTTRIKKAKCKRCRFKITATTNLSGKTPSEGMISICVACGLIQIFNADFTLRDPTPQEREEILSNAELTMLQMARAYAIDPTKLKGQPE